jgi:ABC-type transporter Mla MlaB component
MDQPGKAETQPDIVGSRQKGDAGHTLRFAGALVVARAETIRDELIAAIERHDRVDIDCSKATDVDLTFVQILIAARRTAASWGKSVRLLTSCASVDRAIAAGAFAGEIVPGR